VPRFASPFIVALRERGSTAIHSRRPQSGRVSDRETDPEIHPRDHIPNNTTYFVFTLPALQLLVLQYVEDLRFDDVLYGSSVGMHASAVQILGQIWKKKGLHNYTRDAFTSVTASVQTKEEEGEQK
jgi:hypothetical protein